MIEGISREKKINRTYSSGVGYIVIPANEDRTKYVKSCYRKERVAIKLDDGGGIIQSCYILTNVLREIHFPDNPGQIGSCVAFISDEFNSRPIVVGVVSKISETQLLEENVYKKSISSKEGRVDVEMNGNTGEMFINVDSHFENGGSVYINLNSKNNTSKFNVNCFGDISVYSEGDTSLETLKTTNIQCSYLEGDEKKVASRVNLTQDGFLYEDRKGNSIQIEGEAISIKPKSRLNLFEGKSPIPKGDVLKKQLEEVTGRIDSIVDAIKVPGATGVALVYQGLITAALATHTDKENFDDINSTKSFTD